MNRALFFQKISSGTGLIFAGKRRSLFVRALACLCLAGCTTVRPGPTTEGQSPAFQESRQEAVSALESVVGAMSGKEIHQKDLEDLTRRVKQDPETRSAVETLSQSLSGHGARVKYCPLTGKRYGPQTEICPVHHIPLKIVGEEDQPSTP